MRSGTRLLGATIAGLVATLVGGGCVDLFHTTDFAEPVDAAPSTGDDAGAQSYDDFCALSEAEALDAARRSCAWLSACEAPGGGNAAGACLTRAVLAFDCHANPNRQVRGAAHDMWRCLARAASCGDVHACVFGGPPPTCSAASGAFVAFTSCASAARVDCEAAGAPALGGACVTERRTCVPDGDSVGYCAGGAGLACTSDGCAGTMLHTCGESGAVHLTDGGLGTIDVGEDCALSGAGQCVTVGDTPACLATGGRACTASSSVRCEGNVAVGCPSGVEERVDCVALGAVCATGVTGAVAGIGWDVSRACKSAGTCTSDSCSGSSLVGCVHGAPMTVDCVGLGLGACATRATVDGNAPSCTAPK